MDEGSALSPGRVLRVWRAYAGVTAAGLARALPAKPSTVSMWETDRRGRRPAASLANVEQIALTLERERPGFTRAHTAAMVSMWQAVSTVHATAARPVWFHNWPPPGGPVWIWLRVGPDCEDRRAVLEFGPFDEQFPVASGAGGVIVHAPVSVPNPPLKVMFQQFGWADFAVGVVPAEVAASLGIGLIAARDVIGRHAPRAQPLHGEDERELRKGLIAVRTIAAGFGVPWSLVAPHFGVLRSSRLTTHALDGDSVAATACPGDIVTDSAGALVRQALMAPARIREVRDARGLSRSAAAERATALDRLHPISARALESLESTGRVPDARFALARLDMVYNTDGRLGIDRVFDSRGQAGPGWSNDRSNGRNPLNFPDYWCGHVWLQPRGPRPNAVGVIDLVWGPWRRRQRVRSGTVITTRKASVGRSPLLVQLPRGWHLAAGTGAVPTALDINAGWRPTSAIAALALLRDSVSTIRKAKHD